VAGRGSQLNATLVEASLRLARIVEAWGEYDPRFCGASSGWKLLPEKLRPGPDPLADVVRRRPWPRWIVGRGSRPHSRRKKSRLRPKGKSHGERGRKFGKKLVKVDANSANPDFVARPPEGGSSRRGTTGGGEKPRFSRIGQDGSRGGSRPRLDLLIRRVDRGRQRSVWQHLRQQI